jgi:thiol-disulfide isomerase/thioredoxin/YHS domain-containing protein
MRHATFQSVSGAVLGVLLIFGAFSTLHAQDNIAWEKDINVAMAKAKAVNRLVFVHFYGDNCPPCRSMDVEVFPNRQVVADMNRFFVPVKVDSTLNPQLVKQFDVRAIPADVVLKPNGEFVHRRQGGISAERFSVYLNYINEEAGPKNIAAVRETLPVQTLEPRSAAPNTATNIWNVAAVSAPADPKVAAPVPPVAVITPAPQNLEERSNPVRTGSSEVATLPKNPLAPLNEGQPVSDSLDVSTVEVPLALDGFCPVTLSTQERWQVGNPLFYGMYQGQIYRCVDEAALVAFSKEPAKYAPAAMGEDIVQMVNRNKKIVGQRKFGAWFQDRVYLFSTQESLDAFAAKPEFYSEIALKYETALRTRFDAVQR